MSVTHKRRWYQFSLRTLLVFTTLVCIAVALFALFARSRHFQEQAAFHHSQVQKYKIPRRHGGHSVYQDNEVLMKSYDPKDRVAPAYFLATMRFHEQAADAFDRAARRPWTTPVIPSAPVAPPPDEPIDPVAIPPRWTDLEVLCVPINLPNHNCPLLQHPSRIRLRNELAGRDQRGENDGSTLRGSPP